MQLDGQLHYFDPSSMERKGKYVIKKDELKITRMDDLTVELSSSSGKSSLSASDGDEDGRGPLVLKFKDEAERKSWEEAFKKVGEASASGNVDPIGCMIFLNFLRSKNDDEMSSIMSPLYKPPHHPRITRGLTPVVR